MNNPTELDDKLTVVEIDALLARIRGRVITSHPRRELLATVLETIAKELRAPIDIENVALSRSKGSPA